MTLGWKVLRIAWSSDRLRPITVQQACLPSHHFFYLQGVSTFWFTRQDLFRHFAAFHRIYPFSIPFSLSLSLSLFLSGLFGNAATRYPFFVIPPCILHAAYSYKSTTTLGEDQSVYPRLIWTGLKFTSCTTVQRFPLLPFSC
ncbi:hypothetical protein BDW62DRAFT_183565 [Aspergillus aurantiobrunneus]